MERIFIREENKMTKIVRQRQRSDSSLKCTEIRRERVRSETINRPALVDIQKNIIFNRKIFNSELNDVFAPPPKIFVSNISPIAASNRSNAYPKRDLRVKANFMNKIERKQARRRDDMYPQSKVSDTYMTEYFEDTIWEAFRREKRQVLPRQFIYNFKACPEGRKKVLLWFFKHEAEFEVSFEMRYTIIYLFDQVLAKMHIPKNKYHLFIITIVFIVSKLSGVNVVSLKKLLNACSGYYVKDQILILEKDLLQILEFSFLLIEPSLFINYYVRCMAPNNDETEKVRKYAFKILSSFSLLPEFSTYPPSQVAAASVYAALKILYETSRLYDISSNILGYYYSKDILDIVNIMYAVLNS